MVLLCGKKRDRRLIHSSASRREGVWEREAQISALLDKQGNDAQICASVCAYCPCLSCFRIYKSRIDVRARAHVCVCARARVPKNAIQADYLLLWFSIHERNDCGDAALPVDLRRASPLIADQIWPDEAAAKVLSAPPAIAITPAEMAPRTGRSAHSLTPRFSCINRFFKWKRNEQRNDKNWIR